MAKSIKSYFKPTVPTSNCSSLPEAAILAAKKEVKKEEERMVKAGNKRGMYGRVSAEDKAKIGKYATENGVTASLRHFRRSDDFSDLKESTVRGWMNAYKKQLGKTFTDLVTELPDKKRGRPLLIGEDLEDQVITFLKQVRSCCGGWINAPIALAAAKGIVMNKDSNLLSENGGGIHLTRDWAKRLLGRMGYVKRKATTKAKINPVQFDKLRHQFLHDIQTVVKLEDIPPQLIINWDHAAIKYVPVSCWTQEKKGSKRVEIRGIDDKRQITAVLAGTLSGKFLPPQLIYSGTTSACLPKVEMPADWDVTFTHNHWAKESTMMCYSLNILLLYVEKTRNVLDLLQTQTALRRTINSSGS